jgi:hypothetical protein
MLTDKRADTAGRRRPAVFRKDSCQNRKPTMNPKRHFFAAGSSTRGGS